jgi:signal transduction histidine kinase
MRAAAGADDQGGGDSAARQRPRRRSWLLPLLAGVLLFLFAASFGPRALEDIERSADDRDRALQALLSAARLLSSLKDVETGQRGFLLTGDPAYLVPFDQALQRYPGDLKALAAESADIADVTARLPGLEGLIGERVDIAKAVLAAAGSRPPAPPHPGLEHGKARMDAIRVLISEIERRLRAEVARRDRQIDDGLRHASLTIALATGCGLLLIAAGGLLAVHAHGQRDRAEHALAAANRELDQRIRSRTDELQAARAQIELFAIQLDRSVEGERRRLAREVHDQLGQVFTALKIGLSMPGDGNRDRRLATLIDQGIATVRRIAAELRPALLDDLGLAAALQDRCQQFAAETGLRCRVAVEDATGLELEQATQLYRIACEAMTNVARHAEATTLWLHGQTEGEGFRLSIDDDGRGLPAGGEPKGRFGLRSMRERAALAGGSMSIGRSTHGGLHVSAWLPMRSRRGQEWDARTDH